MLNRYFITLCVVLLLISSASYAEDIRIQLTAKNEARLTSPMSGQIIDIKYKDGDVFSKDDLLIKFECDEQMAKLEQAKAKLGRAEGVLNISKQLVELGSEGVADFNIKKADFAEAKAEHSLWQASANKCIIYAPFDGRVGQLYAKPYDIMQQGQPLIEVLNDSVLNVEMIVPSKWVSFLKPEYKFMVNIDEMNKEYESKVTRIGGKVDPITQSVKIYSLIENKENMLRAGMSGYAQISIPNENKSKENEQDAKETSEATKNGTEETDKNIEKKADASK